METESEQTGKKTLIIWGIPIAILVVLVVLLIIELTDDDEISIEPEQVIKEVVIQPTDENTAADTKVQTFFKEEEETPLESEEIATASEFQATETLQETQPADETPLKDEEQEESYIVEEGDSLWKIAKRKDVLGDPWKWKTILIQNKEKINYTIFSQETGQWKVMVEAGKRLIVKPIETSKSISSFDRTRKKRYAVQLMSLDTNQLDKAVDIVKFLIKDGYFAYLYRTRKKSNRGQAPKLSFSLEFELVFSRRKTKL